MAMQDYVKAQKLAEKQYRQELANGKYPYLPVLENILRKSEMDGQIPLGQFEIPLSMIAGTVQSERTSAFASNFLPLLEYDTEFGSKWSQLYDSVQEVGVNEPIQVCEYMQRFYVREGNKRVSVSKYNGAVSILAQVTRIIPKEADSPEYKIYSEFLIFYRVSGIYEIQMSQPDNFIRLIKVFHTETDSSGNFVPWDEEFRRNVRYLYAVFESHYLARNGQRLSITTGDAFLRFIRIYGCAALDGLSSIEMNRMIDRVWDEFRVLADANPTSRILNPTESSKKVPLTKIISLPLIGTSVLPIAFIYPKDPQSSAWSYNHEIGRRYLIDSFGSTIQTNTYITDTENAQQTIERAIIDGNKLIFTTSPVFHAVSMRMAVAHPEIILLNCSVNTAYKQLRTYYLRIYEAKFITGIIAGSMTENERIGYIADYPILGTPASINAFALGVKLVNPRAMVYLDWSTLEDHDPVAYFRSKQIDLISDRDIIAPVSGDQGFGLYGIYGGVSFRLAAPVWNWGSLYADLVRSVMIGAWKNDGNDHETNALNYFWGMSSGAIDVAYSGRLPSGTQRLVRLVQEQITKENFKPFTGILYGQDGRRCVEEGQTLSPEEIIHIDWLADNIVGRIPDVSEIASDFREFAKWHSLKPAEQPKEEKI